MEPDRRRELLLALLEAADYDVAKEFDHELAEDGPESADARMVELEGICDRFGLTKKASEELYQSTM